MDIASLWARIRVHVIARDYVHPHITRWPSGACQSSTTSSAPIPAVCPVASGCGHKRGFATAVIEKVHVSVTEVPVREAVDDVVEAGLAHSHPRTIVERLICDWSCSGQAGDDRERHPEEDENDKAKEVGLGQRQVRAEPVVGLVVWLTHSALHGHVDAEVDDECGKERNERGGDPNGDARRK